MSFPLGARVTVEELEHDPHPLLAQLRAREPVSWVPSLEGWLVTRHDLALAVIHDADRFTVADPRFSTAQVIGPSMLSLDGPEHSRNRAPFVAPFRAASVRERFAAACRVDAERLLDALQPAGCAELRRSFAGELAASTIGRALGLAAQEHTWLLNCYDAIVAAVNSITSGQNPPPAGRAAFTALRARLLAVIADGREDSLLACAASAGALSNEQVVSNAAVLLFGGVETTEGMIANAALMLLERPDQLSRIRSDERLLAAAVEESLRLEPAAAMIDRYCTVDVRLGDAEISAGDLVRVSIAAANRDPALFRDPDQFELERPHVRRHLAFAQGPHVCVGVHLARLEARTALAALFARLPSLRLDPDRPSRIAGLVFRKPVELNVSWRA